MSAICFDYTTHKAIHDMEQQKHNSVKKVSVRHNFKQKGQVTG